MRHILSSIIVCTALAFPIGEGGSAYAQKIVHDKQKEKQWRSMETGPWDFEPDWYYYFLHKKYSGAETYWKWSGFKSGYRVRFKEHKSNVKTIMPRRVAQEETQKEKIKKVEEERAKVKEMHDEEVIRAADRNVDLVYSTFKDDFNRMQEPSPRALLLPYQEQGQNGTTSWRTPTSERHDLPVHRLHPQAGHWQ
jgi:hypothetical protein